MVWTNSDQQMHAHKSNCQCDNYVLLTASGLDKNYLVKRLSFEINDNNATFRKFRSKTTVVKFLPNKNVLALSKLRAFTDDK